MAVLNWCLWDNAYGMGQDTVEDKIREKLFGFCIIPILLEQTVPASI